MEEFTGGLLGKDLSPDKERGGISDYPLASHLGKQPLRTNAKVPYLNHEAISLNTETSVLRKGLVLGGGGSFCFFEPLNRLALHTS